MLTACCDPKRFDAFIAVDVISRRSISRRYSLNTRRANRLARKRCTVLGLCVAAQMQRRNAGSVESIFVDELVAMGFCQHAALRACKATHSCGIEPALDWLSAHPEELGSSTQTLPVCTLWEDSIDPCDGGTCTRFALCIFTIQNSKLQ